MSLWVDGRSGGLASNRDIWFGFSMSEDTIDPLELWRGVANGLHGKGWGDRNVIFAEHIPSGSSVLDVGCGNCNLRNALPDGCTYRGIDQVDVHDPVVVDFNAGVVPDLPRHDFVVLSGVLEYLHDPIAALDIAKGWGDVVLFSYQPTESRTAGQLAVPMEDRVWKSTLNRADFEAGAASTFAHVEQIGRFRTQTIYRAKD